ncbi:hypothetical protein B0O80DRAFT_503543 [Mortierella sp. GBAus27b]|nr:hypothetical protein B0O80DRAFT_503543 [Mortierella sp. GBAus27b]
MKTFNTLAAVVAALATLSLGSAAPGLIATPDTEWQACAARAEVQRGACPLTLAECATIFTKAIETCNSDHPTSISK